MNSTWWFVAFLLGVMLWSLWRVLSAKPESEKSAQGEYRLNANRSAYLNRERDIAIQFERREITAEKREALDAENVRQFISESQANALTGHSRNVWSVLVFSAVVMVPVSIVLYQQLGAYTAVKQWREVVSGVVNADQPKSMQDMLLSLRTRLFDDPEDSEGWFMLGRTMMSLQQPALALQAFSRAKALQPNDADVLVAFAQASRFSDPQGSASEIDRALRLALANQPQHEGAILMTAWRAIEAGQYERAIPLFESLRASRSNDAESVQMLNAAIAKAKAEMQKSTGHTAGQVNVASPTKKSNVADTPSLSLHISLANGIADKLPPSAKLFVYARPLNGSKMPLAAVSLPALFPVEIELGDAQAMNPALLMSSQSDIELVARISQNGNANTTSGDWQVSEILENWQSRAGKTIQLRIQKQL